MWAWHFIKREEEKGPELEEPQAIARLQECVGLRFPRLGLGTRAVSGEKKKKPRSAKAAGMP